MSQTHWFCCPGRIVERSMSTLSLLHTTLLKKFRALGDTNYLNIEHHQQVYGAATCEIHSSDASLTLLTPQTPATVGVLAQGLSQGAVSQPSHVTLHSPLRDLPNDIFQKIPQVAQTLILHYFRRSDCRLKNLEVNLKR